MFRKRPPLHHLQHIQLEPTRKSALRAMLVERIDADKRLLTQKPFILQRTHLMPIFAILLSLMLGTGTTFAAEQAAPGDLLYPVKVHVNEEVREALTFRHEQKAAWELERAERRNQELARVHADGELTAAMQARLEAYQEEYEEKMNALATKLEAEGNLEAAEQLRARIVKYLEKKYGILNNIGLLVETTTEANTETETETEVELSDEEREELQERRREAMKKQQEEYKATLERRHEVLKQIQEEHQAAIERRHEALKQQQEQFKEQQERRENLLDTDVELEVEVEAEIEAEVE